MALSESGVVALLSTAGENGGLLHLIDLASGTSRSGGRHGAGPGELSGAGILFARADTIEVLDMGRSVLVDFRDDASLIRESRLEGVDAGQLVIATSADSITVLPMRQPPFPHGPILKRLSRADPRGEGRELVFTPDSLVSASLGLSTEKRRITSIPAYDTRHGFVVVGEPFSYTLAVFDPDGHELYKVHRKEPPRRRTAAEIEEFTQALRSGLPPGAAPGAGDQELIRRYADRPVPHFIGRGVRFDGEGRVWVMVQTVDSTYLDLYARDVPIQRITLACRTPGRRFALNADWVVLICDDPTGNDYPELQAYRIVPAESSDST